MSEMGIFETMYSARAIRRFKPDPVPDAIIEKILDAAIRAPSAGNAQDWLFVVITDPAQRQKVGEIYRHASLYVRQVYENNAPPAHVDTAWDRDAPAPGFHATATPVQ